MSTTYYTAAAGRFPQLTAALVGQMFIAGAIATMAFDLWGQVISPGIGLATLSPHGLARGLLGTLGLPNSNYAGYFVHFYLVGLIAYPVGWLVVFKPIWDQVMNGAGGWIVPSAIYGFGLWVFAIGGITAIAGMPVFLGFTGITWVALVGHVLYGIVLGAVFSALARR